MTLVLLLVLGTGVTCFLTVSPGGKRVIASLQQMAKNRQYAQYAQQHIKSATDADKVFMDGKVDEAVWWYQDQIAKAKANKDQAKLADLYYRLSSNYYVLGMNLSIDNKTRATNCKISLEYALKAEEAQPSVKTAAALTDRYRALNDTKNYNKYAQILRDRVKAETNGKIEG